MKTCPRCTLLNPDTALICDCGFAFTTSNRGTVEVELSAARRRAKRRIIQGLLLAGGALTFSVISVIAARPGGIFVIAHGAVVVGVAMMGRGLSTLRRLADAQKENEAATAGGPTNA